MQINDFSFAWSLSVLCNFKKNVIKSFLAYQHFKPYTFNLIFCITSWRVSEILFLPLTSCSSLLLWMRTPYYHISHKLKFLISQSPFHKFTFYPVSATPAILCVSVINRKDPSLLIETELSISHLNDISLMTKEDLPWCPGNCRILGSLGGCMCDMDTMGNCTAK